MPPPPPLAWSDLDQEDYGSGQRIADGGIFPKLEDNDEVAVEHVFQLLFPEQTLTTVSPSFGTLWSVAILVPASAKTLRLTFEGKVTSSGNLKAVMTGTGTTSSDTVAVDDTAYADQTLAFSDITGERGNRVTLEIKGNVASSGSIYARSEDYLTCRWGFE